MLSNENMSEINNENTNKKMEINEKSVSFDISSKSCEVYLKKTNELARDEKYSEAIDYLNNIVEKMVKSIGNELDVRLAPFFYKYGDLLLQQVISRSDLLGEATKKAQERKTKESGEASSSTPPPQNMTNNTEDLQQAWEMLELARVIYSQVDDKESKLHQARVHTVLGDVCMESDQFDQALKEYNKGLDIRKELLTSDDRELADSYTSLALFSLYQGRYEDAIKYYKQAKDVFIDCIKNLCQTIDENKKNFNKMDADSIYSYGKNIKEKLTADNKVKMEDALSTCDAIQERINEYYETIAEQKEAEKFEQSIKVPSNQTNSQTDDLQSKLKAIISSTMASTSTGFNTNSFSTSSTTTTNNVTNQNKKNTTTTTLQVKRKRKPEQEDDKNTNKLSTNVKRANISPKKQ